jgi:hypothetical protein
MLQVLIGLTWNSVGLMDGNTISVFSYKRGIIYDTK